MKRITSLALGVVACAALITSCKKNTNFEKGKVVFVLDGKAYTSAYSAQATYIQPGILTIATQGKTGSDIYPTQASITFEEAAEGVAGTSQNMVFSGSKAADTFASHWDSQLVGSVSGTIETLSATECKGTFAATLKTQNGSKTFEVTEGKYWLDL